MEVLPTSSPTQHKSKKDVANSRTALHHIVQNFWQNATTSVEKKRGPDDMEQLQRTIKKRETAFKPACHAVGGFSMKRQHACLASLEAARQVHDKCATTTNARPRKEASGKSAPKFWHTFGPRISLHSLTCGHAPLTGAGTRDAWWRWDPSFLSTKRTLTTRVDCLRCVPICQLHWVGGPVHTYFGCGRIPLKCGNGWVGICGSLRRALWRTGL